MPLYAGWSEPLLTGAASWRRPVAPADPPGSDITCTVRQGPSNTIVLAASCPEVTVRKTVYADGRVALDLTRSMERLLLTTTDVTLTLLRGHFTIVLQAAAPGEDDLQEFRAPLVESGAVRWLRALVAAIEDMGFGTLEHLGMRFTGALVAQFDGDPGAIPRLARELQDSWSGRPRRRSGPPAHIATFRRAVLRAARQMESDVASYSHWHPGRYGCAFGWLRQVETAWHACIIAEAAAHASDGLSAGVVPLRWSPWLGSSR